MSELGELARQHGGRVQVGECRRRRRVRDVVGGNVNGLHRGDRSLLGRRDALLKRAHLGAEGGLISDRGGHAAEQCRHLGARLGEAEDIVDEQEHVLPLFVAEVLGGGHPRETDAQARARRLRHLAEDERGLLDDARFLHLVVQVIALARPLPHAREDRDAPVLLGDIVDQLLDEHGLADARAPEEARLAAPGVRLEQVHDLDARLEHLDLGRLLLEARRRPVDGIELVRLDRAHLVDRLTGDVDDAAEGFLAHRDGDRPAGVDHGHAARQAIGGRHGHGAHLALAQVLGHFQHQLGGVREDVGAAGTGDLERVVDQRELARLELDVHDRPDDLNDLALAHDRLLMPRRSDAMPRRHRRCPGAPW